MRKILKALTVLLVIIIISGCDSLPDDAKEATKEYCDANPNDDICDGFDQEDPTAVLVNALFNAMIDDRNDDTDTFNCDLYFDEILEELCKTQTDYFAPEKYTELALDNFEVEEVLGSELGYKLTTTTNVEYEIIEFTIGLSLVSDALEINSWEYVISDNPIYSSLEILALKFLEEYQDKSLDNTVVCNKWINDLGDASNCVLIRRSHLNNGNVMTLNSVYSAGVYNLVKYNINNSETNSATYVILENNKFSTHDWEFRITTQFNTESYKFLNDFINDYAENNDACDILDSGVSQCKSNRTNYGNIGFNSIGGVQAGTLGIVDGYITFFNIFSVLLDDDSYVTISLRCQLIDGEHIYTVIEYND